MLYIGIINNYMIMFSVGIIILYIGIMKIYMVMFNVVLWVILVLWNFFIIYFIKWLGLISC